MPLFLGDQYICGRTNPYDSEPIENSENLVASGGVYQAIDNLKREFILIDKETEEPYVLEIRNGTLVSHLLNE